MVQIATRRTAAAPRARERKREILEAAARLFRQRGLHATGMRDIAAALGMAVGNLYYYFRDRQELLAFCQEDALAALHDLAARVESLGLRADARVYLLALGHVVLLNDRIPGSLAHLEVEALDGAGRQAVQERRDAYERAWRQVIAEGVAAGVFRALDPRVTAMAILGAVNWTVKWFRADGPKSAHEVGSELGELLVRGLMAPGVAPELVDPRPVLGWDSP